MFEAQVLQLLRQYLGEYVHGLSAEALKISVWQGNVVLKDLQLKAEALNSLKLPVTVKAGFLGSVTLKVPWNRLGNESVIVLLDRIFIVAEPIQDDQISEEDRKDRLLEAKRRQLDATESAMLEAKEKRRQQEKNIKETTSWITSLITTIIGNLKISITNVHIRYEDCTSNPGKPFCCGVTLSKLAAVTIDENGKETFVTSGALDKLHKSIQLEQLAFYHDSNSSPWKLGKSYSEMTRQEWCEVFEATINQKHPQVSPLLSTVSKSKYLLRPINGVLNYYQYGRREKRDIHTPLQSLSLVLDDVSLTVSENQYCDGLKLLEGISQYRKRIEFSHFRPWVTVHDDPRTWWMYASRARLKQQNKARSHLSWERVSHMCSLRRRYVELYLEKLQGKPMAENVQMKEIEEIVDIEVLLIWRLLAHAKVKTVKLKEANLQSDKSKSGWWGFRWSKSAADKADGSPESTTPKEERELGDFTKQEWDKINEFLSDPAGEEASLFTDQDSSCTLLKAVNATIRKSAITIFDKSDVEILCGCFSALSVVTNLYPSMLECTLKLQSYGLSAPEGSLIKSVLIKDNEQALTASYVRNPLNSPLDWKVSATILPCYVTVWFASFKRFMQFLQSTNAVSPDVASETATVLQNKLEKVRRRAQEQLRLALEEECKFSIHLDLDAPKVRIPAGNSELYRDQRSQLVLDLGHFTLDSDNKEKEYKLATNKQALENIYSRFYISGNDIAAYLVSGTCEWESIQELLSKDGIEVSLNHVSSMCSRSPIILPVIDRCRMYLLFEQLRIPDPAYPSTHIALQVPRLGLHFSPGRYRSLLQLIEGLDPSCTSNKLDSSDLSHIKASWYPADYEGSGMVLVWKGLGNAVAEWQPCWCVLSGSYFYILEAANSRSYQRCCSLNGKQILEVPSSSIGGSEHVLAVCARGMELQKCLEASSSIIIKLTDLESRDGWQTALMATVSRLSSPLSMLIPEEGTSKDIKAKAGDFLDQPVLFVSGGLHELQLSLYATVNEDLITKEEFLLLSLRAGGGEVNVLQQQYDSIISTYLRYLRIEDRLKDPVGSNGQCIARSIINRSSSYSSVGQDEEDTFDDAMDEFGGPLDLSTESRLTHKCGEETEMEGQDIAYSKGDFEAFGLKDLKLAPGETILNKMFLNVNEATGNFVTMLFEMRQFESSNYDGTDVKMSISMATLEFFCNRPTVVALIDFGSEISAIGEEQSGPKSTNEVAGRIPEVSNKNDIVKGLLGQGKSRTVFHLIMSMDSVRVFLNLENGRQLAMLDKEGFHMNLRVFPGTFGINITLGNLRIRDLTLDSNHHWAWICDLRDPSSGSLVKFEFQSFNVDEEDYKGYDYSLSGKLSSVHLVFLYRFIQEVIAYFAALSAPHTQSLTRVVDKVGGIEVLVPQSDIDGLPALKLDVHLVSPIITVPGGSDSKDFMRLDMGYLKLSNAFEWCGGSKYDDSAVHLDVLSAEISGINLVVGVGGIEGKPMIQDAQGISVRVCRPLRDLFKRTPMVQVDVQFKSLKGILSDREYLVITGCAASNIAEMPDLPPDFRDIGSYTEDIGRTQVISGLREDTQCEETKTSRENRTWTTARVNVEIQNVVLELQNGFEREVALARMEMEGLWLNYRSTSLQEITVLLTLPRLCLLDLRPNTKPEMRLMLGSMADAESDVLYNMLSTELRAANTQPPMLVMDTKLKLDSQAFIIRIQRPRILVVLDFIISVSKFFVPSLAAVTHKDKELDPEHDPLGLQQHLRLTTAHFKQEATVMTFSTKKRLIVDYPGIDVFTYDGCGNTMVLDIDDTKISSVPIAEPIIIVSAGKALNFKNIKIKNGLKLKDCVRLGVYSSYRVCEEDGVIMDYTKRSVASDFVDRDLSSDSAMMGLVDGSTSNSLSPQAMNLFLELQAIAPELTFYDSEMGSHANLHRQEKLLRMKVDLSVMYAYRENDVWLRAHAKRLSIDGGSGLAVLEPMNTSVDYACVKENTTLTVAASDFAVHLSFSLMRFLIRLHDSFTSTFQYRENHRLLRCSHFDRIWVNTGSKYGQKIAVWRPRAPTGYAILGDLVTSGDVPPSQAVPAIRNVYQRAKRPLRFELVCIIPQTSASTDGSSENDFSRGCSIWEPVPPAGYVSLGCIAGIGNIPPPLTSVYCIRFDLVTSASISDCVLYISPHSGIENKFSIWNISNTVGSFIVQRSLEPPSKSKIHDLRDVSGGGIFDWKHSVESSGSSSKVTSGAKRHQETYTLSEDLSGTVRSGYVITTTAKFERMWWDKGSDSCSVVSIWRPIPPSGYAIVGDHITEGLEPPAFGVIVREDNSGWLAKPIRLTQCMNVPVKGLEQLYVWYPEAPAGFVSLGAIVSRNKEEPSLQTLRCVRADLVSEVNMSNKPIWTSTALRNGYDCSIWKLNNQANTFLARPDLRRPPNHQAYGLIETTESRLEDNFHAEIKLGRCSVTLLDDFRGLMTPLANISITNINLAANGRAETLSCVCVASMAASTFNAQLQSWEPLVEPFEGIVKYESHHQEAGSTLRAGKRARLTSTSIVNINVTSANMDLLVDSILSWQRQTKIEESFINKNGLVYGKSDFIGISSALEQDDTEKVILENSLGCSVFVRTFNQELKEIRVLDAGEKMQVNVPPMNYGDELVSGGINHCQHIAIYISGAKALPTNDDGNGEEYFYSLHVPSIKQSNQGQKFPSQSARSRCVRPTRSNMSESATVATVTWNEIFFFDLPYEGTVNLDVRVSNQAANSGRGELIGTVSIPLGLENDKESNWRLAHDSFYDGSQASGPSIQNKVYPLQLPAEQGNKNTESSLMAECSLIANIYYFSEKLSRNSQTDGLGHYDDSALLIGLSSTGPWSCISSLLSLGPIPVQVPAGYMALEVAMNEGKKIATLRSLVTISNDTDNVLEVCACPVPLLNSPDDALSRQNNNQGVDEEIFENQRYQPLFGWGSKWPGHFLPTDPGRWSTRDNKQTSQVRKDLEADLPPGWVWTTEWTIDKAGYVDGDGWAYGPDFQSIRWPPISVKSSAKSRLDLVRRRRWHRVRGRASGGDQTISRQFISVIQPGGSLAIPLKYILCSTEFCLQVRPQLGSTLTDYLWGRSVNSANQSNQDHMQGESPSLNRQTSRIDSSAGPVSASVLKHLKKAEILLMCPPANPSTSRTAWWLCIESDANILYDELNSPVCDWKLAVSAPLKLENLLPCDIKYMIFEKSRDGDPILRDRGTACSGSVINITSVDTRKQIYMSCSEQDGWRSEGMILISNPLGEDQPNGFIFIHQQSNRHLNLSLERDFGASNAASRTVRIFVPYLVSNRASLPLSYCVVEIESSKGSDSEIPWLSKSVKAAKHASSRPVHSKHSNFHGTHRVVQCLEVLETNGGASVMFSLQSQLNRTGFLPFSPRTSDVGLLSPRLGIAVCASHSKSFQEGISFRDLEDNERIVVKAKGENDSYFKLIVFLTMSSQRTKVINFQPHTLFVNQLGQQLFLRQCDLDCFELLLPNDPPKVLLWQSSLCQEQLKISMDGYEWSSPFTVESEGVSHIIFQSKTHENSLLLKVEIQNGTTESRFLAIFRHASFISPYRIENHSLRFSVCIRQVESSDKSWQSLPPGYAAPFAWEDLGRIHKLEIAVETDCKSAVATYDIDQCTRYSPIVINNTADAHIFVKIVQEDSTKVVKVADWVSDNIPMEIVPYENVKKLGLQDHPLDLELSDHQEIEDQMHIGVDFIELGLSLVDNTPEEILYTSMQNFYLSYSTGLGSGISRLKLRIESLQVDNNLPLTPMPVLLRSQFPVDPSSFMFKCTITSQTVHSSKCLYPYIGVQVPNAHNNALVVNLHEPIIWRLQQMLQHLNLERFTASQTTDVSVDPVIHIGLLNTSEIRFKVSLAMTPSQRPRGALGFWASLMTALGNTDDLQIRIAPRVHEDICMRQSALITSCLSSIRKDILSHPLLLLSGVDILGNASSALDHISKSIAALSMDKKFIEGRQRQDTKASVEGFGDGVREGAEALGKGLLRGVTGILTKPLEGARVSGMEGFMQGVGKGILGAAAQPVSGVLDLLSKTTEGANAMKAKIAAAITSEGVLMRRRLPRVIGADKILHSYDEFKAQGQILLQLAEGSSMFGPVDIFKIRGKFATTDAYEDHFSLPEGKMLIITHCRVILLQHPTSNIKPKKTDLMKDPCSVLWDVTWENLGTIELARGKQDSLSQPASRLILHLRTAAPEAHRTDMKDSVHVIKCDSKSNQAVIIYSAIQQALSRYGPDRPGPSQLRTRSIVKRPYSGPNPDSMAFKHLKSQQYVPPPAGLHALVENIV